LGASFIGIGLLVIFFLFEMKPDKDEEEKVRIQAEEYLENKFNDNFEIYDTLYDNMGNFEFEYAAKVREKNHNTEFLVYFDDEIQQMVDTYITDKWTDDIEREIRPFIKDHFGEATDFFVFFENDNIGEELDIDPVHPRSYKEFNISPTIRITIPRKRNKGDESILNEFISYLKEEDKLKQGTIVIEYIDDKGVILDDEWRKSIH
jgi:hypothetical protein